MQIVTALKGSIACKANVVLQKDFQTTPEINESGDAFTFVHILQVYTEPGQKSLKKHGVWLYTITAAVGITPGWKALKKQYPVTINNAVLNAQ
jgi:hypothetical protein